jgi:hypothetical protein
LRIPELAVKLGCLQNPLFAILAQHQREGKVIKKDGGWHPLPHLAPSPSAREILGRAHTPSVEAA